jgi:hypothetical protein
LAIPFVVDIALPYYQGSATIFRRFSIGKVAQTLTLAFGQRFRLKILVERFFSLNQFLFFSAAFRPFYSAIAIDQKEQNIL